MMSVWRKTVLSAVLCSLCAWPAAADIEALVAAVDPERETTAEAIEALETANAAQETLSTAAQTAQSSIDQATGLAQTAMNPEALVSAAVSAAVSSSQALVLGAMQDLVDGKSSTDEVAEKVKETHQVVENAPMPEQRKQYDELNKKAGEDIALLFARARFLRKQLKEEEPQDVEGLDEMTIAELQQLSKSLMIKSGERWSKILEMQSYVLEFNNATQIQSFKREVEEESNEEKQE